MKNKNFLCIGGEVISQKDGQKHYINARRLAQLYRVPVEECIFIDGNPDEQERKLRSIKITHYTILRPRFDGDYQGVNLHGRR